MLFGSRNKLQIFVFRKLVRGNKSKIRIVRFAYQDAAAKLLNVPSGRGVVGEHATSSISAGPR